MLTSLNLHLTGDLNATQTRLLAYDWAFPGPRSATRPVRVRTGPLPGAPDGSALAVALPDRAIPVQRRGDELWLNAELHLRLLPGGAELTVTHAGAARDVWALALTELHRAAGWLPLHAALIGTPTHAVLIGGPSGAGKSTACLRLSGAGLTVHAEDRAWVHPDGDALGMDRTLRAYHDSLDRFAPHLLPAAATAPRDPRGKIVLPLPPQPPVKLRGVLLLGEPGPLGAQERVRHAWELTGVPLTSSGRAAAAHSVQALLRAPWQRTTREQLEADLRALLRG